jgi:hypothetical protein
MIEVQVKVKYVVFDFSGDNDVDENYMNDVEESYRDKIFTIEINEDPEYFVDFIVEELSDKLSEDSGWCVSDYDYEVVTD